MERGEGMVAIVRAAEHAGLTVTVLPDRSLKRKCAVDVGLERRAGISKSDVETTTEKILKNTGVSPSDLKHPKSYQFGNFLPLSPPQRTSNLPSFRFRNYESGEMYHAASETSACRNSFVYHGKSSFHLPPCQMDQFAESLRKYPEVAHSSELIRKILKYTHVKQHKDLRRHHSKSIRSLLRKSTSQQMSSEAKKHEYRDSNQHDVHQIDRRLKHSASTIGSRYSSQQEHLNYMYDYLKRVSFVPRGTDVRYLTEMQRALGDSLRNIIENKPTMCPRIQSRYSHHKKHCQGSNRWTEVSKKDNKVQTSPAQSSHVSALSQSTSNNILRSPVPHKVCFCQQPLSCECDLQTKIGYQRLLKYVKEWVKNIPVYANFSEEDKLKQADIVRNLTKSLKNFQNESNFNFKAKKEILKYLNNFPMWHPVGFENEINFKEQIADNLIQTLDNLKFVDEIKKIIEDLPIKFNSGSDIDKLAEKIILKLTHPAVIQPFKDDYKKAIKLQLLDLFQELPFHFDISNKSHVLAEVAENVVSDLSHIISTRKSKDMASLDEIENKIFDWCRKIPEFSQLNLLQNRDLINILAKKLRECKLQNITENDKRTKMQEEIQKWLDEVAGKFNKSFNLKTKYNLSHKLVEQLLIDNNYSLNTNKSVSDVNNKISTNILACLKEWFEEIPLLRRNDHENKEEEALFKLFNKIKQIQLQKDNFVNIQQEIKEIIMKWLQDFLKERNITFDSGTQQNLVNKLVFKLINGPDRNQRKAVCNIEYEQLCNDVFTWLKNIPGVSSKIRMDQNNGVEKLISTLNNIRNISDDNIVELQTKDVIKDFVQTLRNNVGTTIDLKETELLEKVLTSIKNVRKQRKCWNKVANLNETLFSEISNILNIYLIGRQFKDVRRQIIEKVMKSIEKDRSPDLENLLRELRNILSQDTNLSRIKVEELCNKISASIKKLYAIPEENLKAYTNVENGSLFVEKEYLNSTPITDKDISFSMGTDHIVSPIRDVSLIDKSLHENSTNTEYWKNLQNVVYDWLACLNLDLNSVEISKLASDLATDIVDRQNYIQLSEMKTDSDELEHLKYQIFRRFNKLGILEVLSKINTKVNDLHNNIRSIQIPEITTHSSKLNYTRNYDLNLKSRNDDDLVQIVKIWLDEIPPNLNRSSDCYEIIQELVTILNDLKINGNYDNYLKIELPQWLHKIFPGLNEIKLNDLIESLNNHLINAHILEKNVLSSSYQSKKEHPGRQYKEMLCKTISKTLPILQSSSDQQTLDFDLLKERLADAFINLHYFADSKNTRDKFKAKLFKEVTKFCDEYLKRHPESPLNSKELNNNLYNALKMVSVSNIESIKSELEQVRMKEEILEWANSLPLTNLTKDESKINNIISELAESLYKIEKNNNLQPIHKDDDMKLKITKFLQRLSLKDNDITIQDLVNQLIERLKATDKFRTFSLSNIGKYSDNESLRQKESSLMQHLPRFPISTLSVEDQIHLETIRKRLNDSLRTESVTRRPIVGNTLISPPLQEIGVQTEPASKAIEIIQTSKTSLIENLELYKQISPQVIVKEFYWDSGGSNQSLQMNISSTTSPRKTILPTAFEQTPYSSKINENNTSKQPPTESEDVGQKTEANRNYRMRSPERFIKNMNLKNGKSFEKQRSNLGYANDLGIVRRIEDTQNDSKDLPTLLAHEDRRVINNQLDSLLSHNIRKERRDNNICCNCGENILTKCRGKKQSDCCKHCIHNRLRYYSKWCGNCPHPSNLFFRKDF